MAAVLSSTAPPARAASVTAARPRVPTVARVLGTELLRGSAVLTGVATTAAFVYGVFFYNPTWGGTWLGLGVTLRSALESAGPVIVAGAAWAAGRERRRGMGELLGSTARPPWRRIMVGWGAVTLAAILGMATVWAAAAAFVAPVATFEGGRVWHPLVALVSIGTIAAAGTAIGTLVPWRGAAPVAAISAYYVLAIMASGQIDDSRMWLSPSLPRWPGEELDLHADGAVLEVLWFGALTAAFLTVLGARRRVWALAPVLLAIAAAVPLLHGTGHERWPLSAEATHEVCRGDVPQVCTTRMSAYLLDDLEAKVDSFWPRLADLEAAPTRFSENRWDAAPVEPGTVYVDIRTGPRGRMEWLGSDDYLFMNVAALQCRPSGDDGLGLFSPDQHALRSAAALLLSGSPGRTYSLDPVSEPTRERLTTSLEALPVAEQRDWLGRYLTAARSTGPCDEEAFDALLAIS